MIELHRPKNDSFSDDVEETFQELVLAYNTVEYEGTGNSDHPEHDRHLPRIEDGEGVYRGKEEIKEYLHQLRIDLHTMRAFTGDACYIDPDSGEVC